MTYNQAVKEFRAVRADYDRLARLIESPRTSADFKERSASDLACLRVQTERARQAALALRPE